MKTKFGLTYSQHRHYTSLEAKRGGFVMQPPIVADKGREFRLKLLAKAALALAVRVKMYPEGAYCKSCCGVHTAFPADSSDMYTGTGSSYGPSVMCGVEPMKPERRLVEWREKYSLYCASKPLTVFRDFCDATE